MLRVFLPLVLLAVSLPALGQRVDNRNTHYRIWAIDRVITDAQGHKMPAHAQGMLGFVAVYGPGDSLCLVEYVAAKYHDFDALRADLAGAPAPLKFFEKAFTDRKVFDTVAKAAGFTQFNLDKFYVRVP